MAKYRNKFSDRKHSVGGVISSVMAVASVAFFIYAVYNSYNARGLASSSVGSMGLSALMFAVFGLIVGLMSYREQERYYTFSFIGSLSNGIMTVLMVMLLISGL